MTDNDNNKIKAISDFIKPIFLKWEKLRILYNLILILIVILPQGKDIGSKCTAPNILPCLIFGAIAANLFFFAAPIAESYFAWLGIKSKYITLMLFLGGVLLSIPLVVLAVPQLFYES